MAAYSFPKHRTDAFDICAKSLYGGAETKTNGSESV